MEDSEQPSSSEDYTRWRHSYEEDEAEDWKTILGALPFREGLAMVDDILSENDYEMTTHIGGETYWEVALRNRSRPSSLLLMIDEEPEDVWDGVDNSFFQGMYPDETFQPREFPYMEFEMGSPFRETYPVPLELDNLEVRYPSRKEFYLSHLPEVLEYQQGRP